MDAGRSRAQRWLGAFYAGRRSRHDQMALKAFKRLIVAFKRDYQAFQKIILEPHRSQ